MRESANINEVATLKPDWMGFIFYPKSKRYVGTDFDPEIVKSLMPEIQTVGVFVNEEYEDMIATAKKYNFDMVQLHGNESPEYCSSAHEDGFDVIKAFGVHESFDWSILEEYNGVCKYFLFDTSTKDFGGSGKKFDWHMLESYPYTTPFILSGGIGPEDEEAVKSISIPEFAGIDINSCFEIQPALKDINKLKTFVPKIRQQ
ncbi:MAG TPA: phosphoribosylanthranilate isomerase [Bacteroidales bacterium]|nr:phosphoribosylanthranilate isomerase [Bacteroidales bacterium]